MSLVFIRVPKTGTTSIISSIGQQDIQDNPCLSPQHIPASEFINHDHSHKYFSMARDPLQTACSFYYFIKNINNANRIKLDPNNNFNNMRVQADQVLSSESLDEYLLNSDPNGFLGIFWDGLPPEDFMFIGDVNNMSDSVKVLSILTGINFKEYWARKNPARPDTLQPYWVEDSVRRAFEAKNTTEYDLYDRAMTKFAEVRNVTLG